MEVHRLCDKEEMDEIFKNKDFKNAGSKGKKYKKNEGEINLNAHHYDEEEMYMHFFPKFNNLFYLNLEKGMYLCLYDIPDVILNKYIGKGEYGDPFDYRITRMVTEYCIKSNEVKFEYLKNVDRLNNDIDYIDFLSGDPLSDFFETVYTSKQPSKQR